MKAVWLVVAVSVVCLVTPYSATGQLRGARGYTKRIDPLLPPQPAPATPAPQAATPQQPVDPAKAQADAEKAKAEKEAQVKRTVEFQIKRAEGGSTTAQYDLGVRYMTEDGVKLDYAKARKWLEAAKKGGHQFAEKKLAELSKLEKEAQAKAPQKAKAKE